MHNQDLPPVLLSHRRNQTNTSIPEGKISQHSFSQVPIVTRRSSKVNNLSMRDIMTDPNYIDQQLKSLSNGKDANQNRSLQMKKNQKDNLKFLRYKFNPNAHQDNISGESGNQDMYGQLGGGSKQRISMNIFYERKNVLFQDYRAPLIYKKLFIQRQQNV